MTEQALYEIMKRHPLAVLSTVAHTTVPQAALIGIAVTSDLEIVFDTLKSLRKYRNLTENQNVALVVDCGNESTVQYEGVAAELFGTGTEHYQAAYFEVFPDGRERQKWPNIASSRSTRTSRVRGFARAAGRRLPWFVRWQQAPS